MNVVITGIGFVTPLGNAVNELWEAVSKGKPSIFSIPDNNGDLPRFVEFAFRAAGRAIADARLFSDVLADAAVTISSSKGDLSNLAPAGSRALLASCRGGPEAAGRFVAQRFGCRGPVLNVISACATGLHSVIVGARLIKSGRAKVVLAGGTDACLTEFMKSAYARLGVLARDCCCPYDKNRSGFVLSEGAAVVVLEEEEFASRRGASIYGRISSWASVADAYHLTAFDPAADTVAQAIRQCLRRSGSRPREINYINTHGTATVNNDLMETQAIKKAFGRVAYQVPLSSVKPVTGHQLAASGSLELIISLLAMKKSFIPPTGNLTDPDPLCDLDYTPQQGRKAQLDKFLTISSGFGGQVGVVEVSTT